MMMRFVQVIAVGLAFVCPPDADAATDDEGTNSWTDDPDGPHARLEFVAAPEQVAARIEDYMVRRPVRIPSDGAVVPLLSEDGRDPDQLEVLRAVGRRTGTQRPQ